MNSPLDRLRHHVTGAIERGEAEAVVEQPVDGLAGELAARALEGWSPLTVVQIEERLAGLGYRLDRQMDCRCLARTMTGPRAGTSYPCITTSVRERDTGLSAFNADARRDDNFRRFQTMRDELFAVVNGAILEI